MVSTINVSTYELLVKPIITSASSPNRTVIQGYFLTISNPGFSNLKIRLTFKARTPDFNSSPIVAFWDVDGTNNQLIPISSFPCVRTYIFDLPALDTGLFLLLPDVTQSSVITNRNTEIRGYVRLSIDSAAGGSSNMRTLLLSAQQRGTFLPQGSINPPAAGDFDQLAYDLPLASGGSEVTLETNLISATTNLSLPNRDRILKAIEANPSFLRDITNEPLVQKVAELSVEEQQRMLYILLERFQANPQVELPIDRVEIEANGKLADNLSESIEAGAISS
ncbi:hypothetical protein [Rivularia sp. UHCC 0363]|uniref:hypothetical protein n=1 Tax=Rivularia sp. UHCC 0363 TaxID=3110244 RepID=UPI002B207AAC|nr:hypothetical protein [Rivularia sp. UHCC 0363]MEA5593255.1 hypothetical protein [Rivularia sp. UHCC 0363]